MEKMKQLSYNKKPVFREVGENETTFTLQGLERGFANTLGVALRRVLLSSITSLAPFCVRIDGVEHEFTTIKDVIEDVPSLIMNLRKVKFTYDPELVSDNEIIKVKLVSDSEGILTAAKIQISHPSVKVIDPNIHIANISSANALKLEMFLRVGRGFVSFEENKVFISKPEIKVALDTDIKKAEYIAVDSDFSPIEKVWYSQRELNSSSPKIEEELEFNIITNGTVTAKQAIKSAAEILIGHFAVIGDVENIKNVDIFEKEEEIEEQTPENEIEISQMGFSVRSYNALKKVGIRKLNELAEMKYEDLENIKNLGKKSIEEIVKKCNEYGVYLKEGDE
ncbi:DNA-directed RNA polymerase subunit alpha [Mycoplasmopsis mustelae]|uniref:DNA-directed RNA polymerase subunit alpha n=1 Tax=Mycoplasmopsis mustelae TaxID=171289 RepID=A0A4R7UED2_9BACT|nr:DNA-directed RNA polymerase subunit alpha [Mycoplasmopsis mustelae]TDV24436.1 DNA-directed RNA polymerase subunit alpha [Mycoplasmopsis mustelae]